MVCVLVVLLQFPDKVPNDLDFLPAVSAGLVGGVDDYLFHKLIDDSRRQFVDTYILADNGGKAVKIGSVLLIGINGGLFCLDKLHQFLLLCFILGGQLQKPFMGNRARYVVFIDTLENTVKFHYPFFCLFQLFLAPLYNLFRFLKTLLFVLPCGNRRRCL